MSRPGRTAPGKAAAADGGMPAADAEAVAAEATTAWASRSGWHAWRSSAGRWWATRTALRKRPADAPAEWAMTVDANTADGIREVIEQQQMLARSG